jgi:hypothetical protein
VREQVGPNLSLLGQYFIGYTVTVGGAFVGLAYGFIVGFVIGFVIAFVRNSAVAVYAYSVKVRHELDSVQDWIDQ